MRVVYLINGLNGGGAAAPLPAVVAAIEALGHEVEVCALMRQDGGAEARLLQAGVRYRVLGPERLGPRAFFRLLRYLRRAQPDLLWTSLARATLLGQLAGACLRIPVVSWQHNAWLKRRNRVLLRLTRRLTRLWVADSPAVRAFAIAELGIDAGRFMTWPLFVADPQTPQAAPWRPGEPFRIGSLGRLHPNKRYDRLIRALARMQALDPVLAARIRVVIGGRGEEEPALRALARALGVANLDFAGFTAQPQVFLAGLHAYVQPSRNEGLCLAAHEAMNAGLPVVATPVGQLACSVVSGVNGWQVPVDDEEALAEALLRLARDPAVAAAMGERGRHFVLESFGLAQFRAVCAEILGRAAGDGSALNPPAAAADRRWRPSSPPGSGLP